MVMMIYIYKNQDIKLCLVMQLFLLIMNQNLMVKRLLISLELQASIDNRSGTSSFGDFNGDGLIDMAVTNGNYSSYEVYIIFGKQNENWPSTFDANSRNSSNVIAFTKGSGSKAYNCDSLMMGDINADGFDDLQCFSPDFVWVVYDQVDGKVLANADFNNDKILDLMVVKSNVLYGIYGEKLLMSASLGLINTTIEYSSNGSYILLDGNYSPVSENCPLTSIKVQVINAQPSDSLDIASSNDITVKKLSPSTIIIYNNNRDSKFLQKISKIQYSTQRKDSIASINFKFPGYLDETISDNATAPHKFPCICPANNTCINSLCVPPGTTDINAGCAKYPCTYGLDCNSHDNKCEFRRGCMTCADLKCGINEECELRISYNPKCRLFPFCVNLT
ncbi:tenascin X [Tieghemostelium lacteum]|uniref:Tenascin X n=1 Tax=Tieghemostelium lacteum TaxID=361077 RepID=A0A151ZF65_TIELA|nr:tenascin X [Tieghemostelium lacteum]|eukprot:KYQ92575.1 tenascin X [Tieghemostelium lacteum]